MGSFYLIRVARFFLGNGSIFWILAGLSSCLPLRAGEELAAELPESPERFHWSGWAGATYLDGTRANQEAYLNLSEIYLYGNYRWTPSWQIFAELEYERPTANGGKEEAEIVLDRAYLEYRHATWLNVRVGKYNIPAGIWKDLHWAVLVDGITEPLMEANRYIPQHGLGITSFGRIVDERGEWRYDLMVNTDAAEGERVEGPGLNLSDHPQGAGFNLARGFYEQLTIGASLYYQRELGSDHRALMGYGDWNGFKNRVALRFEYLYFERTNGEEAESFYIQAKYKLGRTSYLAGRWDYADETIFPSGGDHYAHVWTLGFLPGKHLRAKLEFAHHMMDTEDTYRQWSGWLGWVFQ